MGNKLLSILSRQHSIRRFLILSWLLILFPVFGYDVLHAQNLVSGTVVDEKGDPVVGCMVFVKNAQEHYSTTDMDGKFSMDVPTGSVLVFSMMGMVEVETPASSKMSVVLKNEVNELDDAVVVGYMTQKRASLTGAISSIDNEQILTTKSQSLAVSLAGKVPGLRIRQTSGMPGAFSTDINMRGMGTPMIVIDGVVRQETTEFQKLNPDDIESVTVLKDASAAIYGMNSSNGAIIITTKSGKKGPLKVSFGANLAAASPTAFVEMFDTAQYWEIRNENAYNSTGSPMFATRELLEQAQSLPYVDWYGAVFKKASFQQTYNLSVEGGNDKIQSYTNVGYTSDNGLLKSGDINYNKFSLRNGTKYQINDYLRLEMNLYGYVDYRTQPGTWDDSFFYLNKSSHGTIPSEPIYANNNEQYWNKPQPTGDNPVQNSRREEAGYTEWRDKFFQGQMSAIFDIPKVQGLYLKASAFYDAKSTVQTRLQKLIKAYTWSEENGYTLQTNFTPSLKEEDWVTQRFNFQGSVNYKNTFGNAHNVSAVAVFETRHEDSRYLRAERFYDGDFYTSDNIDRVPENGMKNGGNTSESAFVSVIGRFNYDFKGRYLVEFAFREDGSYRYHPAQRWGFFPVASAGWRISEEPFVKNNTDIISNLKIRGSWGRSGEDAGSPFQYITGYGNYNGYVLSEGKYTNGFASTGLVNQYLTWVSTETTDIGLDLSLWNGMFEFSGDIYRRDRDGLLARRLQAITNTFGATLPEENLNSDRTQGFEISVGHKNRVGEFNYGITANMNYARTMVTYQERAPFRSSWDRWKNGSVGRYNGFGWGYNTIGQFQSMDEIRNHPVIESGTYGTRKTFPGDYIHEDVNGNGIIDGNDQLPMFWTGAPKMTFGLTFYFDWKGIDFNMLFSGSAMYTAKYGEILGRVLAFDSANSPAMYYDRWHKADIYDPNSEWIPGKFPTTRANDADQGNNILESQVQRVDASHVRLKNVELGYTFPAKLIKKAWMSNLRVYVNLTNPLIFCNEYLKTFDPELTDGNGFQYPLQRSYNFGINISF